VARRKSDSTTIVDVVFMRSGSLSARGARAVLNEVRRHRKERDRVLDRIEDALRSGAAIPVLHELLNEYAGVTDCASCGIDDVFYELPAVKAAGLFDYEIGQVG
jgi:hypothetical protein